VATSIIAVGNLPRETRELDVTTDNNMIDTFPIFCCDAMEHIGSLDQMLFRKLLRGISSHKTSSFSDSLETYSDATATSGSQSSTNVLIQLNTVFCR